MLWKKGFIYILKRHDASVHLFEKPLVEVAGMFMDCLVRPGVVVHYLCTFNARITLEDSVNLLVALEKSVSGNPVHLCFELYKAQDVNWSVGQSKIPYTQV